MGQDTNTLVDLLYELAEKAGPLSPMALAITAIVALAIMFNLVHFLLHKSSRFDGLIEGWSFWMITLLLAVSAAVLYVYNERQPIEFNILNWILLPILVAVVGLLILQGLSRYVQEFSAQGFKTQKFLAGTNYSADAKAILEGRRDDVSLQGEPWKPRSGQTPRSSGEWFRTMAGQIDPKEFCDFVWPQETRRNLRYVLWLGYLMVLSGSTLALAIVAIEMVDVGRQDDFRIDDERIEFASNSAVPSIFQNGRMRALSYSIMRQNPLCLAVTGHTDSRRSGMGNDVLSERRAQYVADWLKKQQGLQSLKMSVKGKADKEPLVPEQGLSGPKLEEAWQSNRRVDIHIGRKPGDC
ncbi:MULTISPECIES: OmpA family protein [unclassified Agrobacterium]